MGIVINPTDCAAKSTTAHSGLFSERIAIRSPEFKPFSKSDVASASTLLASSFHEQDASFPSCLKISAFLFGNRSTVLRNRRAKFCGGVMNETSSLPTPKCVDKRWARSAWRPHSFESVLDLEGYWPARWSQRDAGARRGTAENPRPSS